MSENNIQQILELIEDSNLEYDNLLPECRRIETEFIGFNEYRRIREGRVETNTLQKRLQVLQIRGWIRMDNNNNIFPLRPNLIGRGRYLNDEDRAFVARNLNFLEMLM